MNIRSVMLFASALATSVGFLASPAVALDLSDSAFSQSKVELPRPVRVQTGSKNGKSWIASSLIIGQTPTSGVLPPLNSIGGGNPIYRPTAN